MGRPSEGHGLRVGAAPGWGPRRSACVPGGGAGAGSSLGPGVGPCGDHQWGLRKKNNAIESRGDGSVGTPAGTHELCTPAPSESSSRPSLRCAAGRQGHSRVSDAACICPPSCPYERHFSEVLLQCAGVRLKIIPWNHENPAPHVLCLVSKATRPGFCPVDFPGQTGAKAGAKVLGNFQEFPASHPGTWEAAA